MSALDPLDLYRGYLLSGGAALWRTVLAMRDAGAGRAGARGGPWPRS